MVVATRETHEGKACIYVDPTGNEHAALITRVWGPQCVNLVLVGEENQGTDSYGLKLVRQSSCTHMDLVQAHGNFWKMADE